MIKEKIDLEVFSSDFKENLAADKGEPYAELDQELAQVREQLPFEISLLCIRRESQEVEVGWIFDDLLREVGLWWWQRGVEVRERLPLAPVKATLNLHDEDISAPAVDDCLLCIPEPFFGVLYPIEKPDIMAPR